MEGFRVLEIKQSVFESNDREADKLRAELKKEKVFLLNLMSSPGSGKTQPRSKRRAQRLSSSIPAACAISTRA